ncbi:hypothetical protein WMY93_004839 [Mugilogobius chulae]|uniref:Neogenin C-terminal domain-containing protein n=1 Tax=Mugilogobius chulae TaxID=88201 RepID=A0AAW0Q0W6_9GOBI
MSERLCFVSDKVDHAKAGLACPHQTDEGVQLLEGIFTYALAPPPWQRVRSPRLSHGPLGCLTYTIITPSSPGQASAKGADNPLFCSSSLRRVTLYPLNPGRDTPNSPLLHLARAKVSKTRCWQTWIHHFTHLEAAGVSPRRDPLLHPDRRAPVPGCVSPAPVPPPPSADALNGSLIDAPDSHHSSQQSLGSAQKSSWSRDSSSSPLSHGEEDHVYSFPNKQKSSDPSTAAMTAAMGSNLSELDRLLLELNTVQQSAPPSPPQESKMLLK